MSSSTDKPGTIRLGWGQIAAIITAILGGALPLGGLWWQVESLESRIRRMSERIDRALLRDGELGAYTDPSTFEGPPMFTPRPASPIRGSQCQLAAHAASRCLDAEPMPFIAPIAVASGPSEAVTGFPRSMSRLSMSPLNGCWQMFEPGRKAAAKHCGRTLKRPIIHVTESGTPNPINTIVLRHTGGPSHGRADERRAGGDGLVQQPDPRREAVLARQGEPGAGARRQPGRRLAAVRPTLNPLRGAGGRDGPRQLAPEAATRPPPAFAMRC